MNEIKGLILSSIDYKEKSKIVYLYTPYGHDSIKANRSKDLSSGLLGFTTTLNEVSYIKSNAKFPTLIEYHLIESHFDLTSSLDKLEVIPIILKIIQNIPEDTNHKKVFNFIIEILKELKNNPPKKVLAIFLIKMTYVFGVQPILNYCINCGKTENLFSFSWDKAAVMCRSCSVINMSMEYKIWKEYYKDKKEICKYTDTDFDKLLIEISKYYQKHLDIELNFK